MSNDPRIESATPSTPPPGRDGTAWPRALPWLLLAGLMFGVWWLLRAGQESGAARNTFRPRAKAGRETGEASPAAHLMPRAAVQGLRDAYSSASIDPAAALWACGGCQALYHAGSLAALRAENRGRCATCGGTQFAPVQFTD